MVDLCHVPKSLIMIKSIPLLLLFSLSVFITQAQPGPIKNIRYEDDFSYLLKDTTPRKGWDKLKYIPLSPSGKSTASLGGEIREWYEIRRNPNFGDLPPGSVEDNSGALQHRAMFHGDLQFGKRFRIFGELNNTLEFFNPNPPVPEIIVDGLGVHQFFTDINLGKKGAEKSIVLRLGRQELDFGNGLLVSSREGPNNRLPFDGASFIMKDSAKTFHFFAATPIVINPDVFDNTHTEEAIWGVCSNLRQKENMKLDLSYIGMYSERRAYNYVGGNQHRHTIGARLYNHGKRIWYEAESMYQTGEFESKLINAFNFTGEGRYIFKKKFLKPMVGLGLSFITGDYSSTDNQINTFDPMFPKPVYGLATPQGPSNIAHIKPTFGISPSKRLYINFSWYWLARTSTNDGTYAPSMVQVRPLPGMESDKISVGTQYTLDAFYFINKNIKMLTFISYVEPGKYVTETGAGKNIFFWASAFQYKF